MPRYIDAERLPNDNFFEGLSDKEKAKVIQWFLIAPTADVQEVKHGEWIVDRSPVEVEFKCSECGFSYIEADSYQECNCNYCPHCGAKMDGNVIENDR